jgi:uncharacterized protein (TIGR02246 family)
MQRIWLGILGLLGLLWAMAASAQPASPQAAIETLLREQSAAWSRGDLDAFCSIYADDAFFVTPSGITRGRQAVLDRYRAKYPDRAALGTLSLEIQEFRDLGSDGASVAACWVLSYPGQEKKEGYTLIVFRKVGDTWKIVQDASM